MISNVTAFPSATRRRLSKSQAAGAKIEQSSVLSMAEAVGSMGHWHWHIAGDAVLWSDQVFEIAGLQPQKFVPTLEGSITCYHPDDRPLVRDAISRAISDFQPFEFDARLVRPDGEVRNVIVKAQVECDDNKVVALFGVVADVTDAFATISSIQDQHQMLDLAAELAQLGHWVWSANDDAISFCSDKLAKIHGISIPAFLARFTRPEQFANAMVLSHRDRYRDAVVSALESGSPYAIEYRLVADDGTQKEIREIGHPLFDVDGVLTRYIGTVQDVTDTKLKEHELRRATSALEAQAEAVRRSEAKFRDIVEGSIQGIVVVRDFKPVFANEAYARMLGLPGPDEVIALGDLRRVLLSDISEIEAYRRLAIEGRFDGKGRRVGLKTVDGRVVWTDAVGRKIDWEGSPAYLLTVIDVTERHLAEQELLNKTHQLQELNLQKDKLFSVIAHDLKGPFNSVIGFSDLLVERAGSLSADKISDYARLVRDSAVSVHGLFENLLAWAAFQIRDAAPRFAPVDLSTAIAASLAPIESAAVEKGIAVKNMVDQAAPGVHVLADEDMLHIVIRNLISNGIKFSHPGGTVLVTAQAGSMVRISIQDTGVGMRPADTANLFRFDRHASMPGTRGEKGTGLGLYLCHDIVTRHGGKITVESTLGKGCTFHVHWPRAFPSSGSDED